MLQGRTCLHHAVLERGVSVDLQNTLVQLLLQHGADVTARDHQVYPQGLSILYQDTALTVCIKTGQRNQSTSADIWLADKHAVDYEVGLLKR